MQARSQLNESSKVLVVGDRKRQKRKQEIVMDKRENNPSNSLLMKKSIPKALLQIMAVLNILVPFITLTPDKSKCL